VRVSEVVALKVSDIDSKRMVIRIEQGKGAHFADGERRFHAMVSRHFARS
jgi:integrase